MTAPKKEVHDWDQAARNFPPTIGVYLLAYDMGVHPGDLNARLHVIQDLVLKDLACKPHARRLISTTEVRNYQKHAEGLTIVLLSLATIGESDDKATLRLALKNIASYLNTHMASRVPQACGHTEPDPRCACEQNWMYRSWVNQMRRALHL